MNFAFSQDQLDLQQGASEFLSGVCTPDYLRGIRENRQQSDLWPKLVGLGLTSLQAPESCDGLAMGADTFALVAEKAGEFALPDPLSEVAGVAVPILWALGEPEWIKKIVSGDARVHVAHPLNPYLNQVDEKDWVLICSADAMRLASATELELKQVDSIDPLRRLSKIGVIADAGVVLESNVESTQSRAAYLGATFIAAELLGLTERMIEMSTLYAQDRHQFGKPIGSYQAIKHHLASARVKLEFARPVVYRAAWLIDTQAEHLELAVAQAKLAATDAATFASEVAIQVHGGMGYTFEVDLHMWMKRAWALSGLWGSRQYHMQIVEQALIKNQVKIGPSQSFNNQ